MDMARIVGVFFFMVVCLGGVLGSSCSDEAVEEAGCSEQAMDIAFVLDESGSIWAPHFQLQSMFVSDVISGFDLGVNRTHIGIMTFDDEPRSVLALGHSTMEAIDQALENMVQHRGGTKTYSALQYVREQMLPPGKRPWVPQIVVVITDGESDDVEQTISQAALLKDAGTVIIVVGVGHSTNANELQDMASEPTDHFRFSVTGYDSLRNLRNALAWSACHQAMAVAMTTTLAPTLAPTTLPPLNGQ